MKLSQILTPDQILLGFCAEDKWQAIRGMAGRLAQTGGLDLEQEAAAVEALIHREKSMTTGMENGVAIPHAALEGLPGLLGVLALSPEGISFATLDGEPGRILVCLLIPRDEKLLHIRTLAEIARLLSSAEVRDKLLGCETPEQVLAAIRAGE